jgi:hypothetical protein
MLGVFAKSLHEIALPANLKLGPARPAFHIFNAKPILHRARTGWHPAQHLARETRGRR